MLKNLYLPDKFFWMYGSLPPLFLLSFFFPLLFLPTLGLLGLLALLTLTDAWLLFRAISPVEGIRQLNRVFSLGETQEVSLSLKNNTGLSLKTILIDELPEQLQIRDFLLTTTLAPFGEKTLHYPLRPLTRGVYHFGYLNTYLFTSIGLLHRRLLLATPEEVAVYPSIVQMKKFEFMGLHRLSATEGLKKIRRIGHSYEFEQIRNYVPGDDFRSINWKASGRRNALMVNQYEDERSQQIYCILDKSRLMQSSFNGMQLLDYAVNTSLVISNISLLKYDKAGLITFSDKMGSIVKADNAPNQLQKIMQVLYREKARQEDANFELLFRATNKLIHGRSLLLLFTNFESKQGLERALPLLRRINQTHLLLVILFENTEIVHFVEKPVQNLQEVYHQTMARKYLSDKQEMVQTLRQYGIQAILAEPEKLSLASVNKYLELKSRGLI